MRSLARFARSIRKPGEDSHKGENGRLLIIGGSRKYHGAAVLSILGARRFCDLVYLLPVNRDEGLINAIKSVPEIIVLDDFENQSFDSILFGNGLGDADFDFHKISDFPLVIDADGFNLIKRVPKGSILTPHEKEFKDFFGIDGSTENVERMASKNDCIILKKGPIDIISDGERTIENRTHNPGMTRGGTGDVLAGLVSALRCTNPPFESAAAGAYLNGLAGNLAKEEFGLNFCASDVAERLPYALKRVRG